MKSKIVWIASYPKSGNTWLRLLLANYFFGFHKPILPNELGNYIIADTNPRLYFDYAKIMGLEFKVVSNDYSLRNAALKFYLNKSPNVFMKTHTAFHFKDNIPFFDDEITGFFIYIVRDPRDVLVSLAHHNLGGQLFKKHQAGVGGKIDNYELTLILDAMSSKNENLIEPESGSPQHLSSWDNHVNGFRDLNKNVLFLRYEDLITDVEECFIDLIVSLTGQYEDKKILKAINNSKFTTLQKYEKKFAFKENISSDSKFFRSGKIGSWKKFDNQNIFRKLEKRFGKTMDRIGYKV